MEQEEKTRMIQFFSKIYGFASLTHPPESQFAAYSYRAKERCVRSTPPSCPFDRLPEFVLHEILSRLSNPDLWMARQTCVAWHRIISLCPVFQQFYDERNHQSWIVFTSISRPNPEGFLLFNPKNPDQCYSLSLPQHLPSPFNTGWLLLGVSEGFMLLASREGRLAVANPLRRRLRLLPNPKICSHRCLEPRLEELWQHDQLPSISINIVVEPDLQTFEVMVLGEVGIKEVDGLIYSSSTDAWTTRRWPWMNHKLFRSFFHSTVHGHTIYCASIYPLTINCRSFYPKWLVRCNTETHRHRYEVDEIPSIDFSVIGSTSFRRVQTIGILGYRNIIFLLGILAGRHGLTAVGLWEANSSAGHWKLLTTTPVEWVSKYSLDFWSYEIASAYDGDERVSIIARNGSIRTIMLELNLDTKEWKMLSAGIAQNKNSSAITSCEMQSQGRDKGVKAFHMKFKFHTAIWKRARHASCRSGAKDPVLILTL